jgi:spore coat protein U-like protein
MKRLFLAAVFLVTALVAPAAQAQTFTSGQFNVMVTLNSGCSLGAIGDVTFAYTAFQGVASNAGGGGFNVTCTNGLAYTLGLEAGTTVPPTPPGAATINVIDQALTLSYTLGLSAAGGTGTGLAQAYNVTGTMGAGQAGNCGAGSCNNNLSTNRTHTLIVDF